MNTPKPAILLIDDKQEVLNGLAIALRERLNADEADINLWCPSERDTDVEASFKQHCGDRTVLVVTDNDLTTSGLRGLFGPSIVAWSQAAAIPVGDFSRGNKDTNPKEPNLFELRVPPNDSEGSAHIANLFRGFLELRSALRTNTDGLNSPRRMSAALASALGRPQADSQFALYMTRLGAANASLVEYVRHLDKTDPPDFDAIIDLAVYITGHVLANAILRFPGPILSIDSLCAYCGTSIDEKTEIENLFIEAKYSGPFSGMGSFYWREDIDKKLDFGAEALAAGAEVGDSVAQYNRAVVEAWLKRPLAKHGCKRCDGDRGGFWCPFTKRPVCDRSDCSVPSSIWVPQGATLTRVERDFYDELAPLLGF